MTSPTQEKRAGYLLMASGLAFFLGSYWSEQIVLSGPGIALFVIGAAGVRRAGKREKPVEFEGRDEHQ